MGIADYKPDPGENTTISGIDIAEGCAPKGVNNALRQIMADLADSPAKDPLLLRSEDEHNAIARGSDSRMFIPSGSAVMTNPGGLISSDDGNLLELGSDDKLYVDPNIGDTIPWDSVTEKPSTFTPSKHAASHLPGGSDPVTFPAIPSGLIMLWRGAASAIPTGWALCNGQNGTPDLRDRFVIGAGGTVAVGAAGGGATAQFGGNTGNALSLNNAPAHTHTIPVAFSVSPSPVTGGTLCVLAGYAVQTSGVIGIASTTAGSGTMDHAHSYSGTVQTVPPYYALCYVMKT